MSGLPDESRSPDLVRRGHQARLLRDPEALVDKYLGLIARSRKWHEQRDELNRSLKDSNKNIRRLKTDRKEDEAELTRARAEIDRLKNDLQRVRRSRTMKAGRAALAPARALRRVRRAALGNTRGKESGVSPTSAPTDQGPGRQEATAKVPASRISEATQSPAKAPRPGSSESEIEKLLRELDDSPTPTLLLRTLNALWFEQGDISRASALIEQCQAVDFNSIGQLADRVAQIRSAKSLLDGKYSVPPRARGTAYRAEPGRVLYCVHSTPAFGTNGYSIRTGGIADGLHSNGVDVVVVARAGFPWDSGYKGQRIRTEIQHRGVTYVHHPGVPLGSAAIIEAIDESADAFMREARRQRPEMIHAASNYLTALPALITARRLGVPFVYEVRGLWELSEAATKPGWENSERFVLQVELESLVMREADRVLAITPQVADVIEQRGVDPARIDVLPNGVDADRHVPLPADEEFAKSLGIDHSIPWIGFAGSMVAYEGLDVLLNAAHLLQEQGYHFKVVLAGGGSEEPKLKALADELGISEAVHFLGRRPHDEIPRLLSLLDVVVGARLDERVTQLVSPLKPLEAFAHGRAVVLSAVAPHRELAGEHEERALLCEPGSHRSLASALARLLDDEEERANLGRASRLWVSQNRQWRQVCAPLRALQKELQPAKVSSERNLGQLRVGLIADEFTTKTIAGAVELVKLNRRGWASQLDDVDFVFIESAWTGNDGQWHRGVGYYSHDEHANVRGLIAECRRRGLPTVFWNKEDPIHFQRFLKTAILCDHIFTVDADLISRYRRAAPNTLKSVAGLPFYAQPRIHHPLADAADESSVAYAGTYYGARYPERTKSLRPLLRAATEVGLSIYDRQALIDDSPYSFPEEFASSLKGGLPYDKVLSTYRSHVAHLNVNSVPASPTMFSRRVVEIAASGGVVLSGPSRALVEMFPNSFPAGVSRADSQAYLHLWTLNPAERRVEAWRQMRSVLRAHTADDAMAIVARSAGIPVNASPRSSYAVQVKTEHIAPLLSQSCLPAAVVGDFDSAARSALSELGIEIAADWHALRTRPDWVGVYRNGVPRTWYEDLLLAAQFGEWDRVRYVVDGLPGSRALAIGGSEVPGATDELTAWDVFTGARQDDPSRAVTLAMPLTQAIETGQPLVSGRDAFHVRQPTRLLVAGHDLKFIRPAFAKLEQCGFQIETDVWTGHSDHDVAHSTEALRNADVILAEWSLGNSVWYAEHRKTSQRLIVRAHMQELRRPYLRRAAAKGVDEFVFVSEIVRNAAVHAHGVNFANSIVIPNFVNTDALARPKTDVARKRIGFVGYVPRMKRLDRAIDVLESVLAIDPDYSLVIKGRHPKEYPWMLKREEEMAYYSRQFSRIDNLNERRPGSIVVEPHGDDMAAWYQSIGTVLSVSDFESFHYTVADGAAAGSRPAVLAWGGSDLLYPADWLRADIGALAEQIVEPWSHVESEAAQEYIASHYSIDAVVTQLADVLRDE